MSQAPDYTPTTDFSQDQSAGVPGGMVDGSKLDTELANIEQTLDAIRIRQAIALRDDDRIRDGIVEPHALSFATLVLINSGLTPKGDWATATVYSVGDIVANGGAGYMCAADHTSGVFVTDVAAEKWNILSNYGVDETDTDTAKDKAVSNNMMRLLEAWRAFETSGQAGQCLMMNAAGTGSEHDVLSHPFEARISLVTGVAETEGDESAATKIYLVPMNGDRIALYDTVNSAWKTYRLPDTPNEIEITVPSTTNTNYDLFLYDNAGTLTLEAVAWSSDTARVALEIRNSVKVQASAHNKRHVGAFRTTNVSGQTEDSRTKRFLINRYNQAPRSLVLKDTGAWFTYSTATLRQWRGSTAYQVEFLCLDDSINVMANAIASFDTGAFTADIVFALGLDSTVARATDCLMTRQATAAVNVIAPVLYNGYPGEGKHFLAMLQQGGTFATSWYGGAFGVSPSQAGISGSILG